MRNTIYKDRLLKLANLLDEISPDEFYFGSWAGPGWNGQRTMERSCGTTACAFGWATAIPEIAALGLSLRKDKEGNVGPSLPFPRSDDFWQRSVDAAYEIFGLSELEHDWLFSPSECERNGGMNSAFAPDGKPYDDVTPSVVAEHIRNFVSGTKPRKKSRSNRD